ncbi:MAG: 1-acyl-sn-glycerol-3-phosphate acyltransferase [Bacteroidales bacterium]|nr:1-acyl-sn-glycerol-3-phosphate acyltransferase [Bacteroidales bacterium]
MSEQTNEFESISPYTDEEAVKALGVVADHPAVAAVSKYIFPDEPETFLRDALKQIHSVDEFQKAVMTKAVEWVVNTTATSFTFDGLENLRAVEGCFLALSNHRDIILDPALTQYMLYKNNMPMTQIAVGDNLLSNKYIELLIRSNRMIKVIRGISARTLYLSSQLLSKYIRHNITEGISSIWLAQREGRTKDGMDTTEQGLLKMLDMSGPGDFTENFEQLNIIPLSISYEYEPCDVLKARELLISRTQKYVKAEGEDLFSIATGIKQFKGRIHLNIGKPLTHKEIYEASFCNKNDRYQFIRHAVDERVREGYKLWENNYIAYDLLNGGKAKADHYTKEDLEKFKAYIEGQLDKLYKSSFPDLDKLDRAELRKILLTIYSNPVVSKEELPVCIDSLN